MNIKTSVFIATSLDGFIARKDGSLDWLEAAETTIPKGEDCGYFGFMQSVDALVMGRHTFEKVLSFDNWPYDTKRVIVLSSKALEIPSHLATKVTNSNETPADLLNRLSSEGVKHVYVDGGITIQRFLADGLINQMIITVIPVVLGKGRSLFGPMERDLQLSLVTIRSYKFGFVQITYLINGKK
jgi:dihydrofolate reductase